MNRDDIDQLPAADSIYVAPHAHDLAVSCAGRLLLEARQGLKILVVTLFGPGLDGPFAPTQQGEEQAARALVRLGVSRFAIELPEARRRSSLYATYTGLLEARDVGDEAWAGQAAELLTEIGHRTRAKQVYVPLAVGGHIDHQIAHEAARAAFGAEGRNVFLYEDRPEALIGGAVRIRLAQMGARLPPVADVAERAGVSYLMRFHVAPVFRGEMGGWKERLRSARTAARHWRAGRAWNPQRAWGPRLQPVVFATETADLAGVAELSASLERAGLAPLASRYAAALGGAGAHAERYWLLLPARETDGLETLPPSAAATLRAQMGGRRLA